MLSKSFKSTTVLLALTSLFITTSCANTNGSNRTKQTEKTESKTTQENNQNEIDFEKAFFVDVRTPAEFASGHFENSTNIPLDQLEEMLEQFEGHSQIIVYCRSGSRSARAKEILEGHGFTNVINGINQENLDKLK